MSDLDHPRVFFLTDSAGAINLAWGYLSNIDGVPWAAATIEGARSAVPATMLRLDPLLLEEQRDGETDEQFFVYRSARPPKFA